VVYAEMLERLDYQQEGTPDSMRLTPQQVRREFDNELQVRTWRVPGVVKAPVDDRPEGAPAWWESDEEASQSFLQAYAPGAV
jgi:hypothetical protein